MYTIDCSAVPTDVTDFAFDQVSSGFSTPSKDFISYEYTSQTVTIEGSVDRSVAEEIKSEVESKCTEKLNDMRRECKNGYEVGYSESELETFSTRVYRGEITLTE